MMKQHILLLFLLTAGIGTLTNAADRTFRFVNKCQQTIWMGAAGVKGQMPPEDGGFRIDAGESKEIEVSGDWESGRFWPRTGCKDEAGEFTCATGNCGSDENGFTMQCRGTSNEKPSTLAEFTLQSSKNEPDFYDLSNVDGHNVGMSIKPIDGQFEQVDNPDLGPYNCGAPSCTFDPSKCPEELKVDDVEGGVACLSICAAIHNAQQREKHEHLQKIYDNEDTRSLVCCSSEQHYDRAPTDEEHLDRKKCLVEKWPKATNGEQYDHVFKSQCPDAYSWQFDDDKSTYQCNEASYEITLCPDASASSAADTAEVSAPKSSGIKSVKKATRKLTKYISSVAAAANSAAKVAKREEAGEWQRVFEDEFNEDGPLDESKWRFEIGTGEDGWGNKELQYYRAENAQCENGQLLIKARREDFEGSQYTSARIKSQQAFTYGRLQIRAKLPSGKGSWSALWMLAEAPGWPQNGEIDLMEQIGSEPSKIMSTVHTEAFNHRNGNQPTNTVDVSDATTEYKIYTLQWDADKIETFVGSDEANPQETSILKWEKGDKDHSGWPFDKPFIIIMNLAVGGNLGGKDGVDEGSFPQQMEIDWVRFDQMK